MLVVTKRGYLTGGKPAKPCAARDSGFRTETVRPEGRPPRPPVLQALSLDLRMPPIRAAFFFLCRLPFSILNFPFSIPPSRLPARKTRPCTAAGMWYTEREEPERRGGPYGQDLCPHPGGYRAAERDRDALPQLPGFPGVPAPLQLRRPGDPDWPSSARSSASATPTTPSTMWRAA